MGSSKDAFRRKYSRHSTEDRGARVDSTRIAKLITSPPLYNAKFIKRKNKPACTPLFGWLTDHS
jgi:hypothetical protein